MGFVVRELLHHAGTTAEKLIDPENDYAGSQ
jgi:hypothetical protein